MIRILPESGSRTKLAQASGRTLQGNGDRDHTFYGVMSPPVRLHLVFGTLGSDMKLPDWIDTAASLRRIHLECIPRAMDQWATLLLWAPARTCTFNAKDTTSLRHSPSEKISLRHAANLDIQH